MRDLGIPSYQPTRIKHRLNCMLGLDADCTDIAIRNAASARIRNVDRLDREPVNRYAVIQVTWQ